MRKRNQFFLGVLLLASFASSAHAEKRVALVVGNSAYQNVARLDNPTNDASLIADTLKELGFALVGGGAQLNLEKAALDTAVQSFSKQIQGADVALFYYAGHGVQVRGSNYLVPINANPTREADVDFQMLDVGLVLNQMQGSGTRLNLVILDACRNNPFGGRGLRSSDGGLAQIRAPEGTLISYATQPGSVAQDGDDGHSPYSKALAGTVRRAGLDIFQTFNEVGLVVKRSTGGSQQPWVSSSPIDGNFYFVSPPDKSSVAPQQQESRLTEPSDPLRLDLVTDCDRLAANPADPQRPRGIVGVRPYQINIVPALSACNAAQRQFPDVARFNYQAGRIATIQKDYPLARELYEKAARKGYPASYMNLGIMYAQGNGVQKDYAEARKWYDKALAAGDPAAMNNIGVLYEKGYGVAQDYAEAFAWYEKAATQGVALSMANLAALYRDGKGTSRNLIEARKWYERAAAEGEPAGMNGLGHLYEQGNGVPKDFAGARNWYEKAAAEGSAPALVNIGNLYRDGNGVDKDYAAARKWYEKAAGFGESGGMGMNNIGALYFNGQGVPKNFVEARKWYEKAAAAEVPIAMSNLGYLYRDGNGAPKDSNEARKWFEKAAAAGDPNGMNARGYLSEIGNGVPQDYVEARRWYEKAAAAGQSNALANLGNLYRDGHGVAKDYVEARNWYEKAAAAGRPYAMANLGFFYERGLGVPKDIAQARKWYELAAAAGDESAKASLKRLDSGAQK
jgi:TPR repeat protein